MIIAIDEMSGNILVNKNNRGFVEIPCIRSHSLNIDKCTYNCPLCSESAYGKDYAISCCEFILKSSELIKEVMR